MMPELPCSESRSFSSSLRCRSGYDRHFTFSSLPLVDHLPLSEVLGVGMTFYETKRNVDQIVCEIVLFPLMKESEMEQNDD
jgi:hypothetical protein